jgi:heme/copper-type cytochrome/quinol oxidase subunit 2
MRGTQWPRALGVLVTIAVIVTGVTIAMALEVTSQADAPAVRAQLLASVLQAGGTLALVLLTAFYAMSTHNMVKEMKLQREATETEARRAQARLIEAHVLGFKSGEEPYVEVNIHNGSDEAVRNVGLRLLGWSWRLERHVIASCSYPLLSAGGSVDIAQLGPLAPVPEDAESGYPPIEIEFTDSAGLRWCRRPDGRLIQASCVTT